MNQRVYRTGCQQAHVDASASETDVRCVDVMFKVRSLEVSDQPSGSRCDCEVALQDHS